MLDQFAKLFGEALKHFGTVEALQIGFVAEVRTTEEAF